MFLLQPLSAAPAMLNTKKNWTTCSVNTDGEQNKWLHEHILNGLPEIEEVNQMRLLLQAKKNSVHVYYAGDFEWKCRNLERSLLLGKHLGRYKKLGFLYDLFFSMALWQPLRFSDQVYDNANRFYLLCHLNGRITNLKITNPV